MKKLIVLICTAALLCGCGKSVTTGVEKVAPSAQSSVVAVVESPTPAPTQTPATTKAVTPKNSVQPKPTAVPTPIYTPEEVSDSVKISITGYEGEVILPVTEVKYEEGQTVFGILLNVTKERKIQMEYSGSKKNAYIKGINNLYEFDKGSTSGWKYSVNGEYPQKSCGSYTVKKNDVIEFKYSLNITQ